MHFNYQAHRFYRQVAQQLQQLWGKKLPKYIVVACSGGPDSIALVDMLHRLAREQSVIPVVVHVNHHLRGPESQRDAKFVAQFCKARALPYIILDGRIPKVGNVQTQARNVRYAALTAVATHIGSSMVVTAHHANDQAETVLLHLMRGSGPDVLAGIPQRRALSKRVQVVRPLLNFTRDDIQAYIRNAKLKFIQDSSNKKLTYTRNWIRKKVLPLLAHHNPKIVEALCQTAQKCAK